MLLGACWSHRTDCGKIRRRLAWTVAQLLTAQLADGHCTRRDSLSLDDGCVRDTRPGHPGNQCAGNANNQNAMIEAIAKANKNTIVVMSVPGAIL